ncbi:MAG TPA: hypothetical protein VGN77_06520 [Steroidobacteraceae bacterium]|nr:hypothetical protein [Steroidobacteraceae bacterium]
MRLQRLMPVVATVVLSACVHVKIDESRDVAASITSSEGVVLLAKPELRGVGSESGFLDCLEKQFVGHSINKISGPFQSLSVQGRHFRLIPHRAFIDSLYPWLEASTAPGDAEFARILLARPGVRERIAEAQVRYVVSIEGGTTVADKSGSMACAAGPGGAACIGMLFWKKTSDYQAKVWDLERGVPLGTVGAAASGNSAVVGAIIPLPFVAPVQHTACTRLASELDQFLTGRDLKVNGS